MFTGFALRVKKLHKLKLDTHFTIMCHNFIIPFKCGTLNLKNVIKIRNAYQKVSSQKLQLIFFKICLIDRNYATLTVLIIVHLQVFVSFDLKCEYVVEEWTKIPAIKNCYTKNLNLESSESVETVNGGKDAILSEVFGLWVEHQTCFYIPSNLESFFPRLLAFGISNSKLKFLTKEDLKPFVEVLRLTFVGNQLTHLTKDLFMYNRKLMTLSLIDSNLIMIGPTILELIKTLILVHINIKCVTIECKSADCFDNIKIQLSICESQILDKKQKLHKKPENGTKSVSGMKLLEVDPY
jgi:hypothetical protein